MVAMSFGDLLPVALVTISEFLFPEIQHVTKHIEPKSGDDETLQGGQATCGGAEPDGVASEVSIAVGTCATTSPVCRVVNPTRICGHLGIEMRVLYVRFEALHANVHHVQGSSQRADVLLASSSVP